ncbi:hypothetical protein HPB48_019434 [Haemaphysalis longicornis]|uniref:Uncharacterized protein n=1 Tax=Haemaphysalis longicornis TaxID=44386 RepID=A0A9J6FPP8_HAELO|nr:hypothetical protein HPB48_019434 [Haemaphysalis longicornis]
MPFAAGAAVRAVTVKVNAFAFSPFEQPELPIRDPNAPSFEGDIVRAIQREALSDPGGIGLARRNAQAGMAASTLERNTIIGQRPIIIYCQKSVLQLKSAFAFVELADTGMIMAACHLPVLTESLFHTIRLYLNKKHVLVLKFGKAILSELQQGVG